MRQLNHGKTSSCRFLLFSIPGTSLARLSLTLLPRCYRLDKPVSSLVGLDVVSLRQRLPPIRVRQIVIAWTLSSHLITKPNTLFSIRSSCHMAYAARQPNPARSTNHHDVLVHFIFSTSLRTKRDQYQRQTTVHSQAQRQYHPRKPVGS